MRVALLPPWVTHPFVVDFHSLTPAVPRVGEQACFQARLAWPALQHAGGSGDGCHVEVRLVPSDDWILLGAQRQFLRLPIADDEPPTTVLTWKLVPLAAGLLLLPALALARQLGPDVAAPAEDLPAPPYLKGGTVLVAQA